MENMTNKNRRVVPMLLHWVSVLNEFKTGKPCYASASFCWNMGIGHHRYIGEYGATDFYLMPFTLVRIFTPHYGGIEMDNAKMNTTQ